MMTRHLAQIKATQKAYEYKHYGRPIKKLSFEKWFLAGVRRQEQKGAEFTLYSNGLVKIEWPRRTPILRTIEDFEREYNEMFTPVTSVKFEEGVGINACEVA